MARLLRIEVCAECSHCQREYASDDMDSVCHCDLLNPDVTGRDWLDPAGIDPACPLPEASGWISVGERRPTECGTYEVAMPPLTQSEQHPQILVCEWAPAYGFHSEVCGTTFVYDTDVLAWRPWEPLPEEASDQ